MHLFTENELKRRELVEGSISTPTRAIQTVIEGNSVSKTQFLLLENL